MDLGPRGEWIWCFGLVAALGVDLGAMRGDNRSAAGPGVAGASVESDAEEGAAF